MKRGILWTSVVLATVLAVSGAATAAGPKHANPKRVIHPALAPALVTKLESRAKKPRRTAGTRPAAKRAASPRGVGRFDPAASNDLATALTSATAPAGLVTGATFVTVPTVGTPDEVAPGDFTPPGFPSTFAILTNGDATSADQVNNSGATGADDSCDPGTGCGSDGDPTTKGPHRQAAHDVTILKISLNVPANVNCLSFDYRFLTEEYPEYVGTPYNDGFIAELDKNTWTATGTNVNAPISAPANFAGDASGRAISVNAASSARMSAGLATDTTYDGATPLLRAATPIKPGVHTLYLSIFDQSDHFVDSAAFVENLDVSQSSACSAGSVVDEQPADLSVVDLATAGTGEMDYTMSMHNAGPATAQNVSLTDQLDPNEAYDGSTGDCTAVGATVTCSVGSIDPGATASVDIYATNSNEPATYFNQVNVTSSTYDPSLQNNQDSANTQIGGGVSATNENADMSVAVTGPDGAHQGDVVEYPIVITNNGPGDVTDGLSTYSYMPKIDVIGFSLPDGVSWPDSFYGCYGGFGGVECDFGSGYDFASGASFEIDVWGYVHGTGWATNTTHVLDWANDPNTANDLSFIGMTATATALPRSDLSVSSAVSPGQGPPGTMLTYTVKATNNGPAAATQAEVVDYPSGEVAGLSVQDTKNQCTTVTNNGFDCMLNLPAGGSDTITFVAQVNEDAVAGDYLANEAEAAPSSSYFDPNFDDNTSYTETVVTSGPPEKADLATSVSTPTLLTVGVPATTKVTITNKGPSAVHDAIEYVYSNLMIDDGAYVVSYGGCEPAGDSRLQCDGGPLAKGHSVTFTIVWIPEVEDYGYVEAFATSSDDSWIEPNWGNNDYWVDAEAYLPQADLSLDGLDATDPLVSGANETYTFTVTNLGYDPAKGVQIVDALPSGETFVSASGKGFACSGVSIVTCTLGSPLKDQMTAKVKITVAVNLELPGTVVNTATVTSATLDPEESNNTAAVLTTVGLE